MTFDNQSKVEENLSESSLKYRGESASAPLVTAVMITGMHIARYALARVALECFKNQTYPNKELLIINHGPESLSCGDSRIHEVRVKKKEWETVGDLRNLAFKHAQGEFM